MDVPMTLTEPEWNIWRRHADRERPRAHRRERGGKQDPTSQQLGFL
jgi:hypothetical protein